MDIQTIQSFIDTINSILDDKLANLDTIELCQIVSDNNGSGKYTVRLQSDLNTIIKDVVSSRSIPFHVGDYVYLLKLGNNLSNSIIVGYNNPMLPQKIEEDKEKVILPEEEKEEVKYHVYFQLGNYISEGYTSLDPEAEAGAPSGKGSYAPGQIVYYFVKIYENDIHYKYVCNGVHIKNNIYRLGLISMPYNDVSLGTLEGVERYESDKYPIKGVIVNGYISGPTSMAEGETTTVRLIPNTHYKLPEQLTSVTGATVVSYTLRTGDIVLTKAIGDTRPVTIRATCQVSSMYSVTFTLGAYISAVYYKINGNENENPITTTPTTLTNVIPYKGTLEWYAVPEPGFSTTYSIDNPYLITGVTRDLSFNVLSNSTGYAVTFTPGNYVVEVYTATNDHATSGNPSGYGYSDGATVFVFVVKQNDTSTIHYECNGIFIDNVLRNGISYEVYQVRSVHIDGAPVDLGVVSNVRALQKYPIVTTITNGTLGPNSDTVIWEDGYANLYIIPNEHYGYPSLANLSVTGAVVYYYNDQTGQVTLKKNNGDTTAVSFQTTCPVVGTAAIDFIRETHITGFYYRLGTEGPYIHSTEQILSLTVPYDTPFSYYGEAEYGYYPLHGESNPGTGVAQGLIRVYIEAAKRSYLVSFTPGYADVDEQGNPIVFTSDSYNATGDHNPTDTPYPYLTPVYGFAKAKPEDDAYYYDYSLGEYVTGSNNLYRMITHTVTENVDLGTIGGARLKKYPITYNITNGTAIGSANYILQNIPTITKYMTVDIIPNSSFEPPTQEDVSVSGATITNYEYVTVEDVSHLRLTLTKPYDNSETPVTVTARCRGTNIYVFQIEKANQIGRIVYTINGSTVSTTSSVNIVVRYGDTYSFYGIVSPNVAVGYTAEPSASAPESGTVTGPLPTFYAKANPNPFPITFTAGNYVDTSAPNGGAYISTNRDATSGDPSGTSYFYDQKFYWFVQKLPDNAQYTYTCSGALVSGNIYRLGERILSDTNGNLGVISSITRTLNQYTIEIILEDEDHPRDSHLEGVYYRAGTQGPYTYSTSNVTLTLDYGTTYSWYVQAAYGYYSNYTESTPYTGQITGPREPFYPVVYPESYPVTFEYEHTSSRPTYVSNAFTADESGQTSGHESGYAYPNGTRVYWYGEKWADTAQYTYDFTGTDVEQVSGNLYQLGSFILTPDNGTTYIGTIQARQLRNFSITGNITNGTMSGATYIAEAKTADIYIKPNNHYLAPASITNLQGATATYSQAVIGGVICLKVTLSKTLGDATPVTFDAECPPSDHFSFVINKGEGIDRIYYTLDGVSDSSDQTVRLIVGYGTDYSWYATASTGYTSDIPSTNPRTGTIDSSYESDATATINQYQVNLTLGSYMTSGFLSINSDGSNPQTSGTSFDYHTLIYYFIEKYADTVSDTYTVFGPSADVVHISGNIWRMGSIRLGASDTTIDATQGGTRGVTHSATQYTLTISRDNNISYIYYKTGTQSVYSRTSDATLTLTLDYDTFYSFYGEPTNPLGGWVAVPSEDYPEEGRLTTSLSRSVVAVRDQRAVTFDIGSNIKNGNAFTSDLSGQTSGNESGHLYTIGQTIWWYGEKKANTASTVYEFTEPTAVQISGDLYQINSFILSPDNGETTIGTINAVAYSVYSINSNITYGTNIGDSTIVQTKTAQVIIRPDANHVAPSYAGVTVTNAEKDPDHSGPIVIDGVTCLQLGLKNATGHVTVSARCRGSIPYQLTFTKTNGVSTVVYRINGDQQMSADFPVRVIVYNDDDYSYYGILTREYEESGGYIVSPSQADPGTGTIIDQGVTELISAIRKKFNVSFTLGSYMVSGYTSTTAGAVSGNTGTAEYTYGDTIYFYMTKESDTPRYAYSVFGPSGEIVQISGNTYQMGSIVLGAADTNIDVTQGGTRGVIRTIQSYSVKLLKGNHITEYYYAVGSAEYTRSTSAYVFLSVQYGQSYSWYGVAETGWHAEYSSTNPYSAVVTGPVEANSISALPNDYHVYFTIGYAQSVYTSTNPNAISGSTTSGETYKQEDTVYYFAKKLANTADYTYDYSAGTLVPGTSDTYRMGSVTINGADVNLGTVGGVRLTNFPISGNITNGQFSGATYITETRTATVYITANTHYGLPTDSHINVVGATVHSITTSGNQKVIILKNPTNDVIVSAVCPVVDRYSLTFTLEAGAKVASVYYKIGSDAWQHWDPIPTSEDPTPTYSIQVYYNTSYSWYVVVSDPGYETIYTQSDPYQGTMVGNASFSASTTRKWFPVTFTYTPTSNTHVVNAFTSLASGQTVGNPSDTLYQYGDRVYWYGEKEADSWPNYIYEFTSAEAVQVYENLYQLDSFILSTDNGNIGTITAAKRLVYDILTGATHGQISGDDYIVQTKTAELSIIPDAHFDPPLAADVSVTGASYTYEVITVGTSQWGKVALSNPTGEVHVSAVCRTSETYTFTISKGGQINRIFYKLNDDTSYTMSTSTVSLIVAYGTTYNWYAVATPGYVPNYGVDNPDTGTVTSGTFLSATATQILLAPTVQTMYNNARTEVRVTVTNPNSGVAVSCNYSYEYDTSDQTSGSGTGSVSGTIAAGGSATFIISQGVGFAQIIGGNVTVNFTATGYVGSSTLADFSNSQPYTITYNINHGEVAPDAPQETAYDGSEPIEILADSFYMVPETINVIGSTYIWDRVAASWGELTLTGATQNVTVNASCVRRPLITPYIEITYNSGQTVATISVTNSEDNPAVTCFYTYSYRTSRTSRSGTNLRYGTINTNSTVTFTLGNSSDGEIMEGIITIRFDDGNYTAENTAEFENYK